jgi:hypothetical protein
MKYLVLITAIALTGCATNDYDAYAKAQADVARAKSDSDTARYAALSKIAETGDASSKIAAVMALALGGNGSQTNSSQIAAPQASNALQWASILVPSVTNIAGMAFNARVAIANADNNARIAESTNSAFLGIAGKIQAPVIQAATVVTPQANVSTVTTTTSDNHAVDNHATTSTTNTSSTSSTASTSTASTSNTTTSTSLGGNGVIGAGSYAANPSTVTTTSTANPVTTSNSYPVTTTTTTNPPGKTCSVTTAGVLVCI